MRKIILAALAVTVSSNMGLAEENSSTDLSRYEIFETDETVKTLAELQEMEDAYTALVAADKCAEALPKIIDFYEAANHTSNLIRRGNEPFYSADRDGKDQIVRDRKFLNTMIEAESTMNNLLKQRNEAWVAEAKCLLSEGERQEAVIRLYRALDYISSDEGDLWKEAQSLLWAEVGYSPKN